MVIKNVEDIYTLVDERIEAIEDLNCEELSVCIKAFMDAATLLVAMQARKEFYAENKDAHFKKLAKEQFVELRDRAWASVHAIDHLTLRTNSAE